GARLPQPTPTADRARARNGYRRPRYKAGRSSRSGLAELVLNRFQVCDHVSGGLGERFLPSLGVVVEPLTDIREQLGFELTPKLLARFGEHRFDTSGELLRVVPLELRL